MPATTLPSLLIAVSLFFVASDASLWGRAPDDLRFRFDTPRLGDGPKTFNVSAQIAPFRLGDACDPIDEDEDVRGRIALVEESGKLTRLRPH